MSAYISILVLGLFLYIIDKDNTATVFNHIVKAHRQLNGNSIATFRSGCKNTKTDFNGTGTSRKTFYECLLTDT